MYISKLSLKNFRNYAAQSVEFADGLNVIYGENASGKTNLLESVYFSGLGKSERTAKDKELLLWGSDFTQIQLIVQKRLRTHKLEIMIDAKGKKRILTDGIPIVKIGDLIGFLNVVFFSPDEMKLIKESPVERRRFMDINLSQQKKSYLYSLMRYNKTLAQRNKSLKTIYDHAALKSTLPIWDVQLAKEGAAIIANRYRFIAELKKYAAVCHGVLSLGKEKLDVGYESLTPDLPVKEIEEALLGLYAAAYDKDIHLGYTSVGPHRDDISLAINGIDVKKFASQGQQRTTALSLKLAEIDLFEHETGEKPIVLLDDVLSELDESRQTKLLQNTAGLQTLLTCTEFTGDHNLVKRFIKVEYGKAFQKDQI